MFDPNDAFNEDFIIATKPGENPGPGPGRLTERVPRPQPQDAPGDVPDIAGEFEYSGTTGRDWQKSRAPGSNVRKQNNEKLL